MAVAAVGVAQRMPATPNAKLSRAGTLVSLFRMPGGIGKTVGSYLARNGQVPVEDTVKNKEQPAEKRQEMTWAQRLKRVFKMDITICSRCGGAVKIIACIEDPLVIKKIQDHLDAKSGVLASANQLLAPRAPSQARLFD